MNFNFSDDLEKLELVIKDTAYTYEHNYSRRSRRTAGRPRSPPCSSRCPLLAVGLSADTAKEGKNARHACASCSLARPAFGHRIFVDLVVVISLVPYLSKWIDDADLWDDRRILS